MKALVVGGTGPTGPHVINGLRQRGYDVTLFHRGVHEPADLPADIRHIHGDPHFTETIEAALGAESFDVVACMYGRVKLLAAALAGRCEQFIAVGGVPAYRNVIGTERSRPHHPALPARESDALSDTVDNPAFALPKLPALIREAERTVFERAAAGGFQGTVIRYPAIHGPRNQMPHEWLVMKRIRDGRPFMILPDGGLGIMGRCGARNAAEILLRVVDHPDAANGQAYNCADDVQYSWRQWLQVVADAAGGDLPMVSLPRELVPLIQATLIPLEGFSDQTLFDTTKARSELGYSEIVAAADQIAETVEWLAENPPVVKGNVAFHDPFDYDTEDRLEAAYRTAVDRLRAEIPWDAPELHHPLPHPTRPTGSVDQMGR